MTNAFTQLPLQAITDHRLGLIDLRVLGSVYSFGSKPGDVVWPARSAIAARCGYCEAVVSKAISRLVRAGWLGRRQNRGPNYLTLLLPETVTDSATVTSSVTVTDSSSNCDRFGPETVTDSVRHRTDQEQTKNRPTTTSCARASQKEDKQPGGASLGGQGRHEGEPAKPVERSKTKRTIPDDWQPGKRCLELLEQAGIDAGFALGLVGEFCLYWQERGDKRPGWDATFLNHVKAQWTREEERHKGGTNVTPLRPVPSGHRNGSGNFRTFEQMRADNTQRAIDEFLFGDNIGAVIDA